MKLITFRNMAVRETNRHMHNLVTFDCYAALSTSF